MPLADKPEPSAPQYADLAGAAIPGERDDAIIVAHSASGMFLPMVPARRRARHLVFLAAVSPLIGKRFNPQWSRKGRYPKRKNIRQFLFHDFSPEATTWALSTLSLMYARQAILEITPLQVWPDVPCSYRLQRRPDTAAAMVPLRCRERLGVAAIELPGRHCPYV